MSITIQNLNKKRFGNFHALKNINLNVPAGKLVSLLGPSGCGKTTLLRIIAGLENADGGQILFDGQDVTAKHVRERKVGFVFQHYALFRHMNVFDNVAFGLTVLPKPERPSKGQIRAKVEELLKLVQLSHLAKSYPHQLSGGQRQRIALARALAVEPKLLLLDEPFGALDAKVRKELRTWLRDIHHNLGVTSILVTHDQEEALEVSDEIVVMNHGKIEQTGSAEAIYRKPENAFVTEFLGEADAFEGRIEKGIWHYNGFAWKLDAQYKWQEQTATGYIRPHEWQIAAEHETPMIRAEIEKIHAVGALTHVLVKHGKQDVHITHLAATAFNRIHFNFRRSLRHDDNGTAAQTLCGQRHALCVIARACRNHAASERIFRQLGHFVVRAAYFERKNRLQIFAFQKDVVFQTYRKAACRFQRRFDRYIIDRCRQDADEVIGIRKGRVHNSMRDNRFIKIAKPKTIRPRRRESKKNPPDQTP